PHGRQISLRIARIAAINRHKAPDPLFLLAGGPGESATTMYTTVAPALERIHRDRDIVLLDQRGTGQSNGLNCDLDEDDLTIASDEVIAAQTKRCLETLSTRADVRYYTTSLAVQDLDRVREALGYSFINLYGASYGTRVAQQYLRHFPQHTRS